MSSNCPSRFSEFMTWILRAPILNIPLFIIFMLFFWELLSQQYTYHLFIPVGRYAVLLEYIMLSIVMYFIYLAYGKRSVAPDKCNLLMSAIHKIPFLKFFVDSMIALMFGYLLYYMTLLYMHKYNLPFHKKQYEVQVLDFSSRGRKKCKPSIKTNFLNHYNPKESTFFYRFIKEYSFNDVCLYGKYFTEGQTIIFDTKETSFGIYVDAINSKVY